ISSDFSTCLGITSLSFQIQIQIFIFFSCQLADPNTHIVWLENADAKLKTLRDIDEGEELRICYIDTSMDVNARQKILTEGFGFQCRCQRCLSGD
uniref:SET domain-containing protein n=1 Tax=Aegilops tauschii subsp. strangulata TaxID=200361 RepID=A0A453SHW2_AEGTS